MDETTSVLMDIQLPGVKQFKKGKVRNVFDLGETLLLVASDRLSAFDCVFPNGIPDKGKTLTQISNFWFDFTKDLIPNHLVATDINDFPKELLAFKNILEKRSVVAKKAQMIAVECVVRGYLSGSGWKEYCQTQSICGIKLPAGLKESDKLPEPIFTPTTKADEGHDLPITQKQVEDQIGKELADLIKNKTIEIYSKCSDYAHSKGIIIADTKLEFGEFDGNIILIDEILTPDSSRFWPVDTYKPGGAQFSYDKQYVRDYLETLDWNKTPPAPPLPAEIVAKSREKYLDAYKKITGKDRL